MQLPNLNEVAIIHYGCPSFDSEDDTIYWIGLIHYHKGEKTYEFWNSTETDILKKYADFLSKNNNKVFIHWSMNSPKFGFHVFKHKAKEAKITNNVIPDKVLDLSEFLKNKYSKDYIDRSGGRLNNLADLNGFTGRKADIEVKSKNQAVDRLELLFSIVQAEKQGKLKTISETSNNPFPNLFNENCYQLFLYLWRNYVQNTRLKQADVLRVMYYLRELNKKESTYVFKATIVEFISFIKTQYGIRISNHEVPRNFNEKKRNINDLRIGFESKKEV